MTFAVGLKIESRERHERFLARAIEKGSVWHLGLERDDGYCSWAESTSNGDDKGKGGGRKIVPLWSDRAYAKQCTKKGWSVYTPYEVPLGELLEVVLPNMQRRKVLVGTNWNAHLVGFEITPKKLQSLLLQALSERLASAG